FDLDDAGLDLDGRYRRRTALALQWWHREHFAVGSEPERDPRPDQGDARRRRMAPQDAAQGQVGVDPLGLGPDGGVGALGLAEPQAGEAGGRPAEMPA